jgi:ELWxxDGT repeat protein
MTRTHLLLDSLEGRLAPSVSLVSDINRSLYDDDVDGSGFNSGDVHGVQALTAVNDTVLFHPTIDEGGPVWTSDGTRAGTHPTPGVQFDDDGKGVDFAGARYFVRYDPAHGNELWRTDGTPQGTRLILETFAGSYSGNPEYLTVAGNTLYFVANGNQLWRSDGTTPGSFPIRSIGINNYNYGGDGYYEPAI